MENILKATFEQNTPVGSKFILQDKDNDPTNLIYISLAILIVAVATVVIRFRNSKYLKLTEKRITDL